MKNSDTTELAPESQSTDDARSTKDKLVDKAERSVGTATSAVGEGLSTLASSVATKADSSDSPIAVRARRASQGLERAGKYLKETEPNQLGKDMSDFVKAHPKASLATGLGFGFLLARALRRR